MSGQKASEVSSLEHGSVACFRGKSSPPRPALTLTGSPQDSAGGRLPQAAVAETAETLEDDEATPEGEPPANEDVAVDDVHLACAAGLADTGDVESRSTGSPRSQGPHGDLDAEEGTGRSEKLQEGPGVPPRAGELPPSEFPLSADEISRFEEDGFVLLRGAFDPEVAAACRESLWTRLQGEGIRRDDPSTWVAKVSLAEIYGIPSSPKKRRGRPWKDALSERLTSAVDQLLGAEAWEEFGCGWWMVTFPGFSQPPWGAEGRWHCDGAHFRHYPHSREIGLVPIFLFSDVRPHGGGTAVLRGSHKRVAEIVWEKAGTTGLTGGELSNAAREVLLPAPDEDVVETTGSAGDVLLTHPLLLHARSTNLAPVEESGVRFMCHPAVPLKCHLDLHTAPETFSVLERTVWAARPQRWRDAGGASSPAIPKPEQCDHSPVELPTASEKRRRGKGKGQGRGQQAKKQKQRHQPRRQQQPQPRRHQPEVIGDGPRNQRAAPGGAEGGEACDGRADQGGGERERDGDGKFQAVARGRSHADAPTDIFGDGDAAGAPDSGDGAEGVDAAVMEAMGFSGFGSFRA